MYGVSMTWPYLSFTRLANLKMKKKSKQYKHYVNTLQST